jgi:nitrogen regulatory protein PII-like uncharacterized protein
MKIPKKIRGYGTNYSVIQKKNLRDKYGKWDGFIKHREKEIQIEKLNHHSDKEETLLHEILHIIGREERIKMIENKVERLSRGLYTILKDNRLLR